MIPTPSVVIEIDDVLSSRGLDDLTPEIQTVLVMALNKIAASSRTKFDRAIRREVAFPASYLRPSAKRLWVRERATTSKLEATIQGRGRATSLARFTSAKPLKSGQKRRNPIEVEVSPGNRVKLKRAFLVNLNTGESKSDGLKNMNVGLAVRTDGTKPANSYKPKRLSKNAWLLYGPSIDQTLIAATGGGLALEMSDAALADLNKEVDRLLRSKGIV